MIFLQKLMLMSQNWFLEGWGGAAQVWAGKKLFSTNQFKFTQKKFFDQAHPLPSQIDLSKLAILAIFRTKKSEFWNCCRNFGQKFLSKFLATWWGPPNLEMSDNAILWNSMHYSWRYDILKITKKCEGMHFFGSKKQLWTGTLSSIVIERFPFLSVDFLSF